MTLHACTAAALSLAIPVAAFAATDTAYNLDVLPQSGSDPALAAALQALVSPPIVTGADGVNVAPLLGSFKDVGAISITTTYQGRAIFMSELAGFRNSIGMLTNSGSDFDVGDPDAVLLGFSNGDSNIEQNSVTPTETGAIVPITFTAGDVVSFFAITNNRRAGVNSNGDNANVFSDVWYGNPSENVDGNRHLVAFQPVNSPFLIFALDDQFEGTPQDFDYNDVLFAIDLGPNVPEPTTWALVLSFLATGVWFWRRQRLAVG